ncbi:hypothetical protein [Kineobactrum salinum]|uniref:Chemotaxis protein CheW n=1 Tax=Kineobactrum salinum TaxID=2708301 RepID=A0A6C0U173_9GAMM|nr:hypothetical protein [Kineobactrum salinum]QIB65648.1 hypothetical protein G3T16_09735 [Kineobactrum salinum]
MSSDNSQRCILLPCADDQTWAVPPNCLAEIALLPAISTDRVSWRHRDIPLFVGASAALRADPCPCAIFLGIGDQNCDFWALALSSCSVRAMTLPAAALEEEPEQVQPGCLGAFRFEGLLCQVPDLPALQARLAGSV